MNSGSNTNEVATSVPSVCDASLPPASEICTRRELVKRHPHLLSEHRVTWALRNRSKNSLSACGAVFKSPCGELLIREPVFLAWLRSPSRAYSATVGLKPW